MIARSKAFNEQMSYGLLRSLNSLLVPMKIDSTTKDKTMETNELTDFKIPEWLSLARLFGTGSGWRCCRRAKCRTRCLPRRDGVCADGRQADVR